MSSEESLSMNWNTDPGMLGKDDPILPKQDIELAPE
jgi:hypothetical protein